MNTPQEINQHSDLPSRKLPLTNSLAPYAVFLIIGGIIFLGITGDLMYWIQIDPMKAFGASAKQSLVWNKQNELIGIIVTGIIGLSGLLIGFLGLYFSKKSSKTIPYNPLARPTPISTAQADQIIEQKASIAPTEELEFEKNIQLLPGEVVTYQKTGMLNAGPGIIALTNQRIIFLKHKLLSSDSLLYIPYNTITRLTIKKYGFWQFGQKGIVLSTPEKDFSLSINRIQAFATSMNGSDTATKECFDLIAKCVPQATVDATDSYKGTWDYSLAAIGVLVAFFFIHGVIPIILLTLSGYLIGKVINKMTNKQKTSINPQDNQQVTHQV